MVLTNLWADEPKARRARLAIGAIVIAGVIVGSTPPASGGARSLFFGSLVLAGGAWAAWSLARVGAAAPLLAVAISLASALAVASGGHTRGAFVLAVLAVAAIAELQPWRTGLLVAAVALCALLVAAAVSSSAGEDYALAVAVPVIGFLAGLARREQSERVAQAELLLAETQRAQEERTRAAALDERVRLAREIHDVLAHSLSALAVQLEIAQALLDEKHDAEGALAQIERSQRLVAEGIGETRQAVATLRGETQSLTAFVSRLVAHYRSDYLASADYTLAGAPRALPPDADLACRRVAQEALTNVRKHAQGASVSVALAFEEGAVVLSVYNEAPARGHSTPSGTGGYGMTGMRERAALVGGSLNAGPVDGGWQVELRVPA